MEIVWSAQSCVRKVRPLAFNDPHTGLCGPPGKSKFISHLQPACQTQKDYSPTRFTALSTALIEASSMFVSSPAPQQVLPSGRRIWM